MTFFSNKDRKRSNYSSFDYNRFNYRLNKCCCFFFTEICDTVDYVSISLTLCMLGKNFSRRHFDFFFFFFHFMEKKKKKKKNTVSLSSAELAQRVKNSNTCNLWIAVYNFKIVILSVSKHISFIFFSSNNITTCNSLKSEIPCLLKSIWTP